MMGPHRSPLARYGGALLAVALATAVRLGLDPILGNRFPLITFFLALIVVAWQCGLGPSLASLAAGSLSVWYLIFLPRGSFAISGREERAGLGVFLVVGAAIALLGGAMRAARDRAERCARVATLEQERLRTTLECIGDAVITADLQGRIVMLNPVAGSLTGWAPAEAEGRPIGEIFRVLDEETRAPVEGSAARSLREGVVVGLSNHTVLVARDGNERPIEASASPIKDARGEIRGVVLVFRDASVRREAERSLRASEERFRAMADASPILIWIAGPDGLRSYFNKTWLDFTGRDGDKEEGLGWSEGVHPDDFRRCLEVYHDAFDARRPFSMEYRLRRHDGGYRWLLDNGVPRLAPDGSFLGFIGSCVDIQDQKRVEQALVRLTEESEQRRRIYETALSNTADPNYVFDRRGRFLYANQQLLNALGRTLPEVIGRDFREIDYPPELADRLTDQVRQVIDTRQPLRGETPFNGALGIREYEYIFVPVLAVDGSVEAVVGSSRDITDRKRMEETLREQAEQLKEADRRKDDFLATLAHELRNPLAPIRNALHLLRRPLGEDDCDGYESDRAMAERHVVHLARLVDDLLDMARITRGKIELRKEVLELAPAISRAVESIQSSVEGRGHALTISLPRDPILVEADPTRLEQVLWNLLSNAAKYTEPGGQIRLEAAREDGRATIRVRDTGIGIEPGMLSRVFDIFVRAQDRSDRAQEGLGIGLSLARTLVELHGGTIVARSDGPGAGSEFIVQLPTISAASKADHRGRGGKSSTGPLPRRRILVVDDNEDAARSLARVLSKIHRQDVRVAHDGPSALAAAAAFRPEAILLDIGMPGMDGYAVARSLRATPGFERTPLLALTGWGQEEDRRQSREAGFDRHLVKPVAPEELRETLAEVLGVAVPQPADTP